MCPNHLFLSVGRSQVPGVRGGNRRVSPSTGLSDFWLPQRDEKINSNFIFVALEKRDFNVDWKISTEQMVYWNSRGLSCELISTQSPLICTSSGMIIGRSSLLIHHDVDINLYYVHLYKYINDTYFNLYQSYVSHLFYNSSGLAIGRHESSLLIWCLFSSDNLQRFPFMDNHINCFYEVYATVCCNWYR